MHIFFKKVDDEEYAHITKEMLNDINNNNEKNIENLNNYSNDVIFNNKKVIYPNEIIVNNNNNNALRKNEILKNNNQVYGKKLSKVFYFNLDIWFLFKKRRI